MAKIEPVKVEGPPPNPALDAFIETLRTQRTTALDAVAEYAAQMAGLRAEVAERDKKIKALEENIALKDQLLAKKK